MVLLQMLVLVLILPGCLELTLVTFGGLVGTHRRGPRHVDIQGVRLAVVVPAHNEAEGIGQCLESLAACEEIFPAAEIWVVADNCADATAEVARQHGANVLERADENRRGKGYALDYVFSHLAERGFDGLMVVDADTSVSSNFLRANAKAFASGAEAVQCRYGVRNPGATLRTRLLNVALMAFNHLRPLGREAFGLSCGILGNGFGVSARTLREVPYTASSIVEDLEYHLRLVRAGKRVMYLPNTAAHADMPESREGQSTQRARWEGGRLRMVREHAWPLLRDTLKGQWRLAEPLLELLLPPLGLFGALAVAMLLVPGLREHGLGIVGLMAIHVGVALWRGGAGRGDLLALAYAPVHVLRKLLSLGRTLKASRTDDWVRTQRKTETNRDEPPH